MEVDVIVHGSDLSAAIIWYALRLRGYSVYLVHEKMRVSEGVVFLPFTSEWVKYLNLFGVKDFTEERKILLKTSSKLEGWFYTPASVCVGNTRRIIEKLLSLGDGDIELWCRKLGWRTGKEKIEWMVKSRSGDEMRGVAQILIETEGPHAGGPLIMVETALSKAKEPELDFYSTPLRLSVPHDRLETSVRIDDRAMSGGAICRTTFTLATKVDMGQMPILYAGFMSGIVRPPWIGDYLAASAQASIQLTDNWLSSGDISDKLLSQVTELATRSNLCFEILKMSMQGTLSEMEVSYILEGIKPPPSCKP